MATITEHEERQVQKGEWVGAQAGRVHSRSVAAAEQLGSLGRRL